MFYGKLMIFQSIGIGIITGFLWGFFFSRSYRFSKIQAIDASTGIFSSILQNSVKRHLILTLFIVILMKSYLILPHWWAGAFLISFFAAVFLGVRKNEA
jgi:hypothetical protein